MFLVPPGHLDYQDPLAPLDPLDPLDLPDLPDRATLMLACRQ